MMNLPIVEFKESTMHLVFLLVLGFLNDIALVLLIHLYADIAQRPLEHSICLPGAGL
ncbi:MAG TPA: hypothetical protein V6C89_19230 [Drouetiella sp.]